LRLKPDRMAIAGLAVLILVLMSGMGSGSFSSLRANAACENDPVSPQVDDTVSLSSLDYPPQGCRPGEVVVMLEDPCPQDLESLLDDFSDILDKGTREAAMARFKAPGQAVTRLSLRPGVDELEAADRLASSPLVDLAEPNIIFRAATTDPNDPLYSNGQQWNLNGLEGVRADQAWDLQRGSGGFTLAVVDTGVEYDHEDLAGRCTGGYDFYNGDSDPDDDNGHGTMVAGMACANTNNLVGVAGLDWHAKVMPLKALGASGEGSLDGVINSIYWAANNGADVINMSFTSSVYSLELQRAVDYAYSNGCVMVAAAGNEGDSRVNYPAGLTYVIGVGSTGRSGVRSSFSNHNSSVDLVAPGESIYGPFPGPGYNQYAWATGTSEATPHVAGTVLLVLAEYSGATPQEVWRRLKDGVRDRGTPGYDEEYGWGLLDSNASLHVPLVQITAPQEYTYPSSGKVSATATCANANIRYMEMWVDGDLEGSHEFPVPGGYVSYTFGSWDLSQLSEGTHTITVKAIDGSGQWSGEDAVTVYRNLSQPQPGTDWYLAEGTTAWGFEEYVLVQNPNPEVAAVHATFMFCDGSTREYDYSMPGYSRLTIAVNELVEESDVSTHISSDRPVVAERSMYWGGRDGGHATMGVTEGCDTWYLAEGSTAWGFEEYVLVQNPNPDAVSVTFNFMKQGGSQVQAAYTLGPLSRFTINVADIVPGSDVSTFVQADQPVIAERAMYWSKGSRVRVEGHCSTGSITAAPNWLLAEGSTAWGFEEYVLLVNPTESLAHTTITFMRTDGSTQAYALSIPAKGRVTVHANVVEPDRDASVRVNCDQPLVVERAMYWSAKEGGTDALGVLQP
jgi:hypothetical protein